MVGGGLTRWPPRPLAVGRIGVSWYGTEWVTAAVAAGAAAEGVLMATWPLPVPAVAVIPPATVPVTAVAAVDT